MVKKQKEATKHRIMTPLLKALDEHLKNTPLEELQKAWKEIEDMEFEEPTIKEIIEEWYKNQKRLDDDFTKVLIQTFKRLRSDEPTNL